MPLVSLVINFDLDNSHHIWQKQLSNLMSIMVRTKQSSENINMILDQLNKSDASKYKYTKAVYDDMEKNLKNYILSGAKHNRCNRIVVLTIEDVFEAMRKGEKKLVITKDITVSLDNKKLKCFLKNGITCKCCGLKGEYFAVEANKNKSNNSHYYLNLYGQLDGCIEKMFTMDHIIPKSHKGTDRDDNLQTLCMSCNKHKGSLIGWEKINKNKTNKIFKFFQRFIKLTNK
jgi:5-methylcytosine-specific restriction endonuclease McrA